MCYFAEVCILCADNIVKRLPTLINLIKIIAHMLPRDTITEGTGTNIYSPKIKHGYQAKLTTAKVQFG